MKTRNCLIAGGALVCAALLALLAGCQKSGGAASSSDPRYPINISVYSTEQEQQPNAGNKMYKWISDNLHVTFTWDILVGDSAQRQGVMIAGQDYPDLVQSSDELIAAGALIPLEDLITQYAPNLRRIYEEGGVWNKLFSEDGHIYTLVNWGTYTGRDQSSYYGDSALWVQKEVLKEAGYPKVVTMDQYFDLLINYAKKHPTINGQPVIPFTILTYDWRAFCLWNPPNFLGGFPNEGNGTVTGTPPTYKNFFTQDISKRWFKKLNELNAQGYIDRTAFTDNYDQYLAKLSSGRVLGIHDQRWQFENGDNALRDQGMYNRTFAPLPIVFDASIRPRYRNIVIPNLGRGMGISIKAKDPVRIMRFMNDLMDEETSRTLEWGIEGQDWQWNEKHEPYRTEQQRANWDNQTWQTQNRAILVRKGFVKWEGSFSDGYPTLLEYYYPEREALLRPEDKELWAAYGVTSNAELMDKDPPPNSLWFPTWNMPAPTSGSDADAAMSRMNPTMQRMLPQIILAPPADFERLWAAYVAEMEANGIAKYEAYMQDQLNKRIAAWSR